MAAIDKIYINTLEQYDEFKAWCEQQPAIKDKYDKEVLLTKYLYDKPSQQPDTDFAVIMCPYYLDAYLIRNCPFEYIQKELKLNYGSSYEDIKNWKLYRKPTTDALYEIGTHYTCIKRPYYGNANKPIKGNWFIEVQLPSHIDHFIWYHEIKSGSIGTWDFSDEFVDCTWTSSAATCKTVMSLRKRIKKWKLPIGSKVKLTGRYVDEEYVFLIKK